MLVANMIQAAWVGPTLEALARFGRFFFVSLITPKSLGVRGDAATFLCSPCIERLFTGLHLDGPVLRSHALACEGG